METWKWVVRNCIFFFFFFFLFFFFFGFSLGFRSGDFFLIAHFTDHCVLVPFYTVMFGQLLDDVLNNYSCNLRESTCLCHFYHCIFESFCNLYGCIKFGELSIVFKYNWQHQWSLQLRLAT